MRIGILTFYRSYNCGAILQAWALKTVLERMGHQVEFPDCGYPCWRTRWNFAHTLWQFLRGRSNIKSVCLTALRDIFAIGVENKTRKKFASFFVNNLPERKCVECNFPKRYDLVVSGSDQVWNIKIARARAGLFLGETIPKSVRMIAYAVSVGDTMPETADMNRIVASLQRFSAISTREGAFKHKLSMYFQGNIEQVVDPTLLLTDQDYNSIAKDFDNGGKPYLYVYTLHVNDFILKTAKEMARRLNLDLIITPVYQYTRYKMPDGLRYGVSPDEMLGYIRGAKYVLAASFHGTAISLLHGKQFLTVRMSVDERESRPSALLNAVECGDRIVNPTIDIDEMINRLTKPLPDCLKKLGEMRDSSLRWLQDAIGR